MVGLAIQPWGIAARPTDEMHPSALLDIEAWVMCSLCPWRIGKLSPDQCMCIGSAEEAVKRALSARGVRCFLPWYSFL